MAAYVKEDERKRILLYPEWSLELITALIMNVADDPAAASSPTRRSLK